MNLQTNSEYLKNEAYENASHFSVRQRIAEKYRFHAQEWYQWLYEQLDLPAQGYVLDLGCGPGTLWWKNKTHILSARHHILTDLSWGMLQDARHLFCQAEQEGWMSLPSFYFGAANAQAIPFAAEQFDVVLALGLLDHMPDRTQALAQIQRVLKPHGRVYFTAGGPNHLQELNTLVAPFVPNVHYGGDADRFGPHNGKAWLTPFFTEIMWHQYSNELVFHESEPILAYALSETAVDEQLTPHQKELLKKNIENQLAKDGLIRFTIEKGVFSGKARK